MEKTQIFKDYADFYNRKDKSINGVTAEFAAENPNWANDNLSNVGCWNCRDCSDCRSCRYCRDCSSCRDCRYCSSCRYCRYCSSCRSCESESGKNMPPIPVIKNIHQKVFEATAQPCALDMTQWHHECGTTHCRAGWVVVLAGEEGIVLEKATSTAFAAMMIYKKSSPIRVSPVQFYMSNEDALADMERCAKEEAETAP